MTYQKSDLMNDLREDREPLEVRVSDLSKSFGSLRALDGVSLTIPPGGFHALLGENGAGKSTLVKCIMGYHRPDDGRVLVGSVPRAIHNPRVAQSLGIGMVYQHFTLVPNMTVAENLTISRVDTPLVVDWVHEVKRLNQFLERMPFKVDVNSAVGALSAGEKQKVEIVKQLFLGARFLILDEPTSVLTPDEAGELLQMLKRMTESKELSVLLITHKMREVRGYADDVTVLRHGRITGSGRVVDLSADQLTEMMVGVQTLTRPAPRVTSESREIRLSIKGVSVDNDRGFAACKDVSIDVRAGEIVGIAGVSGNGQKELVEVLSGQRAASAGQIRVKGGVYRARREEMRRYGMYCLPEEPLRNGCVGGMSVAENLAFRQFDRPPFAVAGGFVRKKSIQAAARELISSHRIKTSSPDAPVESLSGGNVQRMILARELPHDADIVVVANPCFGLDVRAIAEVRARIMAARNRGAAVLLISEDLDELFELADRILVFFDGRVVAEMPCGEVDRATVGRHMAGH